MQPLIKVDMKVVQHLISPSNAFRHHSTVRSDHVISAIFTNFAH